MSRLAEARTGARRPGPPLGRAAPTLGSTQWFAAAVGPQGTVTTLEYELHHAEVARRSLDAAGLGDRVDIRVGAALRLSRPDGTVLQTVGGKGWDGFAVAIVREAGAGAQG